MAVNLDQKSAMFAPLAPAVWWKWARWCSDEYCKGAGPIRHERWRVAGFPEVDAICIRVVCADTATRTAIVDVLTQLPPSVRYHLSRNAIVVGLGPWHGGYQALLPAIGGTDEPVQLIVAANDDDDEFPAVVAHELAHGWLTPIATQAPTPESERAADEHAALTLQLAADWHLHDAALKPHRSREWQAAALARSWGFVGRAADPQRCYDTATLPGER